MVCNSTLIYSLTISDKRDMANKTVLWCLSRKLGNLKFSTTAKEDDQIIILPLQNTQNEISRYVLLNILYYRNKDLYFLFNESIYF